jgi:hypothetical protein
LSASCYAAFVDDKSPFAETIAELGRIPGPISSCEIRDIENAFMGDYRNVRRGSNSQSVGGIFSLPEARDFEIRLASSKTHDNLNVDSTARRYRFLVPFIIKAEMSPGLAFTEGLVTWIHFLSCKSWSSGLC